jgi:cobalt/nickel transport system permease protein
MSGGLGHGLYRPGDTLAHRMPPQCKVAMTVAFVLAVVATPREQLWAFGVYAALLGAVALTARVPPGFIARRMLVETPFAVFAVALPFIGEGERVVLAGVAVSGPGLWAGWNILAKATLGVVASILLGATTAPRDLLLALDRLRLPFPLLQIATFMLRYADVIVDEWRRMSTARVARGFVAGDVRHWPVLARSLGALFLRSYERGERVHLAMLSRGYTGAMPAFTSASASTATWAAALLPAAAAVLLAVSGYWVR